MSDEYNNIDPTLFILNEKNKPITTQYIEQVLAKYEVNIQVKHLANFQIAMTHNSYLQRDSEYYKEEKLKRTIERGVLPIKNPKKAIQLQEKSYERLEFVGDAVIHNILAEYLYDRYETQNEGFMTRLRTKIENGQTLADLAMFIGLHEYTLISRHIEDNGGRENNMHIKEDAFEAFMGALSKETTYEQCRKFFITLMEDVVDFALLLYIETNFKDRLLQYFHKRRWCDPTYGVLDISGLDHKKNFTMFVKCKINPRVDGEIVGIGISTSKKKGEQEAAKQALIKFGVIKNDDEDDSEEEIDELEDE